MNSPARIFVLLSFFALGIAVQSARAQSISTVSPFLPRNGFAGGVTENSPVELRGIMTTPGGSIFGLYDPVKKEAAWVKQGETGREFAVRSYDAANDSVTVEYQGRVLTVALKTAKIESMQVVAQQAMPPRPGVGPQPGPPNGTAPNDARRLEAVAAEVARRRQMRQAAMQQQSGITGKTLLPPPKSPQFPEGQQKSSRPGNGTGAR